MFDPLEMFSEILFNFFLLLFNFKFLVLSLRHLNGIDEIVTFLDILSQQFTIDRKTRIDFGFHVNANPEILLHRVPN